MTTLEFSDRRRLIRSALVAAAIWLVIGAALSLVSFAVPAKEERQFKSVRLTLASPASGFAASSVPLSSVPAVSAGNSVSMPAGNDSTKSTSPSSSQSAPAKTAGKSSGQTSPKSAPAKSSGGLGIPNFSAPVSLSSARSTSGSSSGNSLDFSGSGDQRSPTPPQAPRGANAVTELEGSAASVAAPSSGGAGKVVRGQSSASSGSLASGETQATLGEIAGNAKSGGSGQPGGQSSTSSRGVTGSGRSGTGRPGSASGPGSGSGSSIAGIAFDGAQRKLLYPAKPVIVLPDNLVKLVDSSRSVTVSFTVRTDGSVPAGDIFFTPSAILPAEIRDYLRKEFSTWRFEKSAEDGQARFLYSIRVE